MGGTGTSVGVIRAGGALAGLALAAAVHGQTTLYVDDDAPAGGDGTSWNKAYRDLQDALNRAQQFQGVVEVKVGQGVYTPDAGTKDRNRRLVITAATGSAMTLMLIVRGGFSGVGSAAPDERDLTRFVSVISGDLNHNDGPGWTNRSDNSRSLLRATGAKNGFLFDGLNFRGAEGDWYASASSAIEIVDTNSSIQQSSGPRFLNCTFESNRAIGAQSRAAVVTTSAIALTLQACLFSDNVAVSGTGLAAGVVKFHGLSSGNWLSIVDSRFIANLGERAGAVLTSNGKTLVQRSVFQGNSSYGAGGAVAAYGTAFLFNSLFVGNSASLDGGAFYGFDYGGSTVANCSFVSNYATHGGACAIGLGDSDIQSSIMWANRAWGGGPSLSAAGASWGMTVDYCIVEGGQDGLVGNVDLRYGISSANPAFRDPNGPDGDPFTWEDNDYRLSALSPAIDAGVEWVFMNTTTDLAGRSRRFDFYPGLGVIDMGCYELQPAPCPADFDENGWINGVDFDSFVSAFYAGSTLADIDWDGFVTGVDFDLFVMRFQEGC